MQFGAVDSTVNTGLAGRFGVKSYPTILFIYRGQQYKFRRERTVDGLVGYLKDMTGSPTSELSQAVSVPPFEVIYVLVKGSDDSKRVFEEVATKYLDQSHLRFYVTDRKDLCPSVRGSPSSNFVLRLEKSSEESFTTELDQVSLDDFVEKSNVPLVRQVKGYLQFRPIAKSAPYFFMFILPDEIDINAPDSPYFDAVHSLASQQSRDEFAFGLLNYSGLKALLEEQLKLKSEDMPKFVVYHEVTTSFVVRDSNNNHTDFGASEVLEEILTGDPEWIYALPFTDRARRYVSRQIEQYGIMGQIGFVVVIFMVFFGFCFCMDAYCFPEPTEAEIIAQRERKRLKEEIKTKKQEIQKDD